MRHSPKPKRIIPLILAIPFWLSLAFLVFFVSPDASGSIYLFFTVFSAAIITTLFVLTGNTRRVILASFVIIAFTVLRFFGIGNVLNFLLLVSSALAYEIYYSNKA